MKVESIAECSLWSILQYFWPVLSNDRSWKLFFGLFYTGFTVPIFACKIIWLSFDLITSVHSLGSNKPEQVCGLIWVFTAHICKVL